jgi:diacylglycerol O-acyltransferase / wax synthase
MVTTTPMTTLERSFLALDHDGMPMHVGAIMVLEGEPVTMTELRHVVRTRLSRLPRFRQLATTGLLRSEWQPVKHLDLSRHLFQHSLQSAQSPYALFDLCARIHRVRLGRDEPLWQMHVIDGLSGSRQALLVKTHHAITDGIGGVEVARLLFDLTPGKSNHVSPARFCGEPAVSARAALQGLFGLGYTAAGGPIASQGPFNGHVGPDRSYGGVSLQMSALKTIKHQLGSSLDDVVLAIVAVGLRRYLHDIAYPHAPHALRAMVPVSTRPPGQAVTVGNGVTAMFVDLPLDSDDLSGLVRRIAMKKSTLRSSHAAAGGSMLVEAAGILPNFLHSLVLGVAGSVPFANLVVSDVPGPPEPVLVLGRRMQVCYPMMPLATSVGLSIATMSIGGVMGVGVTADPGLVPDAQRIASSIEDVVPGVREHAHAHAA